MADEEPELTVKKMAYTLPYSQELLDDFGDDLLGKVLRGEIEPGPPPPVRWHRCLACWLVSLLRGHDRCEHGYLICDDCRSDY